MKWNYLKPVWHRTRLGTRYQCGILGYTRANWYEYWAPTVPGYDLDSNVARVCTNKARIYSIKQGLSRFEHDLQSDFHAIVVRFQVRSSTVCYSLVRLNTIFTRLTGHLQGLHTVPPTFVRVRFHTIYIRYWHCWAHSCSGLHVRLYIRCRTVSHGLVRSLIRLYTDMAFRSANAQVTHSRITSPVLLRIKSHGWPRKGQFQ